MKPNRQALIFSTVWPEPDSSAAGVRQMHWIHLLLDLFDQVTLISPSKTKGVEDWGHLKVPDRVSLLPLPMNDWSVKEKLKELNPELVMFDRFILEEQFGPIVYESLPRALILLETQDLHLVRRARESVREQFLEMQVFPPQFYQTDTALRETAAIDRVDFSFLVSSFEEALLKSEFGMGGDQQAWVPFFYDEPQVKSGELSFQERSDFVWIGNFRHAPNVDGLRWFRAEIWPRIRKALPGSKLRIYGAYPSAEVMSWNLPQKTGIEVKGSAESLSEVYSHARVNLAPLRFGAGVKGKILEGFRFGVPVVTTKVGLEGIVPMGQDDQFPGLIAQTAEDFARECVDLYQNERIWNEKRLLATDLMLGVYDSKKTLPGLKARIERMLSEKKEGSLPRWRSKILRHELFNSHKYFSKWIEAKEKAATPK